MQCPICKSKNNHIYLTSLYDDRYGYPGQFTLLQCKDCLHKFVQESISSDDLTDLYTNFYPRSDYSVEDHQPYQEVSGFMAWLQGERCSAFRWVPKNSCVLDIGCGFGGTLGYHQNRGCQVYGVEADRNAERVAEKYGYNIHIGLFDPNVYTEDFFDYVTLDQVIEHMQDPVQSLKDIASVLKPGGTVILSTPNSNGLLEKIFRQRWLNWHMPYHLQQFSQQSMALAAGQANLELVEVKHITNSEWMFYQWVHYALFPKQGGVSPFFSARISRNERQSVILDILSKFHKSKLNHMAMRLLDAARMGDNYLFFLKKQN